MVSDRRTMDELARIERVVRRRYLRRGWPIGAQQESGEPLETGVCDARLVEATNGVGGVSQVGG
jgi:hypothetical protein